MVAALEKEFKELNLKFSIGGQISFDVFPIGLVLFMSHSLVSRSGTTSQFLDILSIG